MNSSSVSHVFDLPQQMVISVQGADSGKVLNNLTTNKVDTLAVGEAVESFVTDIRGWVVAHGHILRIGDCEWWLVGMHPQIASVTAHIDRYIIREDAVVSDRTEQYHVRAISGLQTDSRPDVELIARVRTTMLGLNSELWIGERGSTIPECQSDSESCFEYTRISCFWPRYGRDILEKCIPQEMDRDRVAISFTKGCYLGQETIARLDARGQLQKKLCLLEVWGAAPQAGTSLESAGKTVGALTSVACEGDRCWALALMRRGFEKAGTEVLVSDVDAKAKVLENPLA